MKGFDLWRLCDELTVVQAALLIAGADPSSDADSVEGWDVEKRPLGYEAAKIAISNALRRGTIKGKKIPKRKYDFDGNSSDVVDLVDVGESRVDVDSLRAWLGDRGLRTGFFFPEPVVVGDYLDPKHPRYAPKLAAAVLAWLAVESELALKSKTPKQALTKWLREHAPRFGLADDEGKPNELGIEETAKVANWQLTGGAPKTPGG